MRTAASAAGGPTNSSLLTAEDMRNVEGCIFAPRTSVEGAYIGRHRSRALGSSTEFRDYRAYVPGDDPRKIDWRVFARSDRHYLRNHHQETSFGCHIFLDSSGSMGFGDSLSKLEFGSRFAALLAYLVIAGGDRVSLCLFDETIRASVPPGGTRGHLGRVLDLLESNKAGGRTAPAKALGLTAPAINRRGVVVVISDFFDDPVAIFDALNIYLHRGFQLHLFMTLAPAELELEDRGLAAFHDLETGQKVIAHTRDIRGDYNAAMAEHIRRLRALAGARRVHFEVARTDRQHSSLLDSLVVRPR